MSETITKTLTKVWKIGGQEAKDLEVRPATVQDTCEAEAQCSPSRPNGFMVEMACRQIVRIGTFTGPFVPGHFKAMRAAQFDEIMTALREADQLGED